VIAHNFKFNLLVVMAFILSEITLAYSGTTVVQWLRYHATNQKIAGSIPDGVIGFFR
jgi:hypothetical protein